MIVYDNSLEMVSLTEDSRHKEKKFIKLKKNITIEPNGLFEFHTGIKVICENSNDYCFISGGIEKEDNCIFVSSDKITNDSKNNEIILLMHNTSDKVVKIPAKTTIARVYTTIAQDGSFSLEELKSTLIYKEEDIIIRSLNNKIYEYTVMTLPNGDRQLIVNLPKDKE